MVQYNPEFNKEIRRIVKNFNQKRNRAIKRGYKNMPPIQKVSELKARYATKRELQSELARLEKFNLAKDSLKEIEISGGAKAIKWEIQYLKAQNEMAKKYWDARIKDLQKREAKFPSERGLLDNAIANRDYLEINWDYMSQDEFTGARGATIHALKAPHWTVRNYRGFLSEVEGVMRMLEYDEKQINRLLEKFEVLNPDQFFELYNTSDLISRVYALADSPTKGGLKLNEKNDEKAEDVIDELISRIDEEIAQVSQ